MSSNDLPWFYEGQITQRGYHRTLLPDLPAAFSASSKNDSWTGQKVGPDELDKSHIWIHNQPRFIKTVGMPPLSWVCKMDMSQIGFSRNKC